MAVLHMRLMRMGRPNPAEYHMLLLRAVILDEKRGRYHLTRDHKAKLAGTTCSWAGENYISLIR